MIKVNELRIGNCVNYTLPEVIQEFDDGTAVAVRDKSVVCSGKIQEVNRTGVVIEGNSVHSSFINPIPLTPEILEKCRFNIDGNGSWIHESGSLVNDFALEYDKSEKHNFIPTISMGECSAGIAIKYLHQLQNKYFDWYGEELEIKL